ncbi:luciferin 4-monooxygenase-like [Epargyreus clarus]|uniref:luciferin 4-monooxygenase-like n=1 Tax=Epargyreus clarus TaxID=520877 RepID=UPI003C2D3C46
MNISKPRFIFCSPQAYENHGKTFSSLTHIKKIIIYGDHAPNDVILYNYLAYAQSGGKKYVDYDEFETVDVLGANDLVFILYSSGTTGLPKGVMLTHLNMLTMSLQPEDNSKDAKVLVVTPWHHALGLVGCFSYLTAGRSVIFMPRFEPGLYLKTIEKYQVSQITSVPPILITLSKYPSNHDLSSVKLIYCGAAPLKTETINEVCKKFPSADTVRQGYGMTESTLAICKSLVVDKPKVGSVGKIVKTTTLKIVDIETRKPLGKLQEGELCAKGPLIMKGYIGKDRKEDFDDEGFFRTGDIGYYDEEGYVFIVGRLKELIKYKGIQVAPAEIEAVLLQHEGLRDAGVIGIPDDDAGEVPLAFVVLQPGANLNEDDVKRFVSEKLSNPKRLRGGVRFVSEIPKNPSGKILRNRLKDMLKASKSKL